MLIAVIGVDGSGKTTLVNRICRHLIAKGRRTRIYRIRQEAPSIRIENTVFFLFPFIEKLNRQTLSNENSRGPKHRSVFFRILQGYGMLMFYLDAWALTRCCRKMRRLHVDMVCDRYLDDVAAHLHFRGLADSKKAIGMLRAAVRPDMTVWMRVSEEKGIQRRPEHPRGYFQKKERSYRAVLFRSDIVVTRAEDVGGVLSTLDKTMDLHTVD